MTSYLDLARSSVYGLVVDAAQKHGEVSEECDHEVGDLQCALEQALMLMTPAQLQDFMTAHGDAVKSLLPACYCHTIGLVKEVAQGKSGEVYGNCLDKNN